jgi:hypothetical protein
MDITIDMKSQKLAERVERPANGVYDRMSSRKPLVIRRTF